MQIFAPNFHRRLLFWALGRYCLVFLCLFLCLSCSSPTQQAVNLNKNIEIPFVYSGSGHLHGLNLELQGMGHGELELHEGNKKYTQWTLKGEFKDSYGGDWYTPSGKLVWKPRPGQSQGQLQITYQFRD